MEMPQEYGWATVAVMVIGGIIAWIARAWRAKDERSDEVRQLMADRRKALAEGRITDAVRINRQIRALLGLCVAVVMLAAGGCRTVTPEPLVIGERIYMPAPGETLTIPPLVDPAQKWYLVDDVALDAMGFAP